MVALVECNGVHMVALVEYGCAARNYVDMVALVEYGCVVCNRWRQDRVHCVEWVELRLAEVGVMCATKFGCSGSNG